MPGDILPRSLAGAAAGAGLAAAALAIPAAAPYAAAAALAGSAALWWRVGPPAAAAALPLAALAGGGWWALAGFSAAAGGLAAAAALWLMRREDAAVLPLIRQLRDAEHERADLDRQIRRFPLLLDACVALSAAREIDHFAAVLALRARAIAPEAREVLVFLARGGEPQCRAGLDPSGAPAARQADADERYVADEARALIRRSPGEVRVIAPLRADRRQVMGAGGGEAPRGALSLRLAAAQDGARVAVELAQALARLGGIALAAVELVEQARALALRDELTGLLGRQEFLRRLDEQAAHARRHGRGLALLLCDLDHLKRWNDTWGHAAGDAALRAVAQALEAALPRSGLVCRWGGEEFCACLPADDGPALAAAAEAVRAAIAAAQPDPARPGLRITASLGGVLLRKGEAPQSALERADQRLYAAKAAGRDRVEIEAP